MRKIDTSGAGSFHGEDWPLDAISCTERCSCGAKVRRYYGESTRWETDGSGQHHCRNSRFPHGFTHIQAS